VGIGIDRAVGETCGGIDEGPGTREALVTGEGASVPWA
jgi:hypothetical protein